MKNGLYLTGTWSDGTGDWLMLKGSQDFPYGEIPWYRDRSTKCEWQLWSNNKLISTQSTRENQIPEICDSLAGTQILVFIGSDGKPELVVSASLVVQYGLKVRLER
jgi:hypothetical protein